MIYILCILDQWTLFVKYDRLICLILFIAIFFLSFLFQCLMQLYISFKFYIFIIFVLCSIVFCYQSCFKLFFINVAFFSSFLDRSLDQVQLALLPTGKSNFLTPTRKFYFLFSMQNCHFSKITFHALYIYVCMHLCTYIILHG